MQLLLALASLSIFSTFATADPKQCRDGWRYCGKTLYNMKWTQNDITDALISNGGSVPDNLAPNLYYRSLFECDTGFLGASTGLKLVKYCHDNEDDQCINAGKDRDDYCKVAGWKA